MTHSCHWPNCPIEVPPALWGCKSHWFKLPKHLRSRIWATYRKGQEITKTPSLEYILAAKAVQEWIVETHGVTLMTSENNDMVIKALNISKGETDYRELCRIRPDGSITWTPELSEEQKLEGMLLLKGYGISQDQIDAGKL